MEKKLPNSKLFKRVLCLIMAFVMVFGMLPMPHAHAAEEGTKLYLKPNSNWLKDGARFAIYYWNDSGNSAWAGMSDADADGYYEGTVPSGYSNVIFCRMNPSAAANDWSNKWNQTSDLTVPTDGTNCYTVADGTWDNGGGAWSVYNPAPQIPETTVAPETTETPETTVAPETTTPVVQQATYIIAGDSALCGTNWDLANTDNAMTLQADGTYVKVYASVPQGTYNLKVTDGTWDNSWGDNGQNYTFVVSATCDVTVTFNPSTYTVTVTGDHVDKETGLEITSMIAVGNGSGAWLNGANWDVASAANQMTEVSTGVYEITFQNVPEGTGYQFKFAANGSWTHSWGGGGAAGEAVYNGQNVKLSVTYALANVTLRIDMTGYDHSTKTGATYSVTVTEVAAEPETEYYLIGYINGANYGCEEDYANMGEYKFVDGKLTVKFDSDSYVFIKTAENAAWYMFQSYVDTTSGTLYNTESGTSEKMFLPGGVELELTLVENADGTLTLSYAEVTSGIPEGYTAVTLHFLKPETWGSAVNGYLWVTAGAIPGYEAYNAWPGAAVEANASHAGWYDLVVATPEPTAFNFIFNDGGNQTADLFTGEITGDTELWIVGNTVSTTAPGEWSGDYDYTTHIHFQKPAAWAETINAWLWTDNGAIAGYEEYNAVWPGKAVEACAINEGWYNISVTTDERIDFKVIFNDGTNQTADIVIENPDVTNHIWVVNGSAQTTAPEGWVNPDRIITVPGTFPGPSWDAGSNVMTYDSQLGLYVYTFEDVPAANYEYKIAVDRSWNENYGDGGVRDGANIAVAVPETMDVTVYYNDQTHYSVTNVTYVFADVTLSGTGIPEGTKLTDKGLTGIYSGSVQMAAGTYTDVKIICDGVDYPFEKIEVKEDKLVTFYMDPVTGIYYNDASGLPVDTAAIYYNSQDAQYKLPFGAVAVGEEVSFSIDSGADVTAAVLVVKGQGSFPMTAEETETGKRWSTTATFNKKGEFDYYFSLTNGSSVVIYCDDDGNYGEGVAADLKSVKAYDLVVYEAGFETPDWMKNAVIYQIFPDRFFDGDITNNMAQTTARGAVYYEYVTDWYAIPENPEQEAMLDETVYKSTGAFYGDGEWSNEIYGGDLDGITQRIGYLKALGVNVIYLNPVFASISNHRYDACDYTEIDPILGTLGDFEELVAVAEANGMHIILDGVFNHVSDDSIYFDRYYKFLGTSEKIGAYPYWAYVYDYMAENAVTITEAEAAATAFFTENYGITDYSYTEWFKVFNTSSGSVDTIGLRAGKDVYSYDGWWGYDSMPIIHSTNGSEYQTGNWAQEIIYNANGSSVTQYWIAKGNDGWRLDVANEVSDETWQRFRDSVKAMNSDAVIIGEIWDDATKYLKGDMYDSVMNYLFRNAVTSFAMGTNAADTTKAMERIRERYPEEAFYAMMNLVGSHDTSRLLSYLDGIGDDRSDKSIAAAFPTYAGTSAAAKARQYLVAFLQFTYAGAPTIYYGDEIGMVGADDPDDRRAFAWGQGNQALVEWYAKLAAIRAAYPALRTGSVEPLDLQNNALLAYVRADDANTLTVIANNSASAQGVYLPGTYVDVVSGNTYTDTISIPSRSGVILVAAEEVKTISVNTAALAPAYDSSYTVAERPHIHVYKHKVVTPPTEDEQGYTTYTCDCGDSYVSDYVDPLNPSYGTESNPITEFYMGMGAINGEIPAGTTMYYSIYGVGGMIMTIGNAADLTVTVNGVDYVADENGVITAALPEAMGRMPVNFSVTNNGEESAAIAMTFAYPVGSMNNPEALTEDEMAVSIEEGSQGHYFTWTAPADGTFVFVMGENENGWIYNINNMTSYVYGDTHWSDDAPVVDVESVAVKAGDELQIMVNTYDPMSPWNAPAGTVNFCYYFSEAATMTVVAGKSATLSFVNPVTGKTVKGAKLDWTVKAFVQGEEVEAAPYATVSDGKLKTYKSAEVVRLEITATMKDNAGISLVYLVDVVPGAASVGIGMAEYDKQLDKTHYYDVTGGTEILDVAGAVEGSEPSVTLSAKVFPFNASQDVSWKVSGKVVTVTENEDGTVTLTAKWDAKKEMCKTGTVTVTATAKDGTGKKASFKLKVTALVSSISIETKNGLNMGREDLWGDGEINNVIYATAGQSLNLKAVTNADATNKAVTWQVFSGYGKITPAGKLTVSKDVPYETVITVVAQAKDGSYTSNHAYVVVKPRITNIYAYGNGRLLSNTSGIWNMTPEYAKELKLSSITYPYDAADEVIWKSSNSKIAKVVEKEDGVYLQFLKAGKVSVTATATDGSKESTKFTLKVVKGIESLSMEDQTTTKGKTLKLASLITINPKDASNKSLKWEIIGESYGVTLSSSGVLNTKKADVSNGAVTITICASPKDGFGATPVTFEVTVNPKTK